MEKINLSFYLRKNRMKNNGKYPVQLIVNNTIEKKRKFYSTPFELTEPEYKKILKSGKIPPDLKELKIKMEIYKNSEYEKIKSIQYFTFDKYENFKIKNEANTNQTINEVFLMKINELKELNKFTTAHIYEATLKSILKFAKKEYLKFIDITPEFLKKHEFNFTKIEKKSKASVGYYARNLRAIFNIAQSKNIINSDVYPFNRQGKQGGYNIPTSKNTKDPLTKDELNKFINGTAQTIYQQMAKDLFLFSLINNGMNYKDILLLKFKDIDFEKKQIKFFRKKTDGRSNIIITTDLNNFNMKSIDIIIDYLNTDSDPENYVLNILNKKDTEENKSKMITNFISAQNKQLAKYCKHIELKKITTYQARHTYAMFFLEQHPEQLVALAQKMGHANFNTTNKYIKDLTAGNSKYLIDLKFD